MRDDVRGRRANTSGIIGGRSAPSGPVARASGNIWRNVVREANSEGLAGEERGLDAIDEIRHVGEIDRHVRARRAGWRGWRIWTSGVTAASVVPKVGMGSADPAGECAPNFTGRSVVRNPENIEIVVHGCGANPAAQVLPGAERHEQFAAGTFLDGLEVDRAVAFVTQKLDERGTTLFLGRLQLAIGHANELHLQGLDEEILRIPAVRTRKRQNEVSVSGLNLPGKSVSHPCSVTAMRLRVHILSTKSCENAISPA